MYDYSSGKIILDPEELKGPGRFRAPNTTVRIPAIVQVLNDMRSYWPLTVRGVFYQLVGKGIIENAQNRYWDISKVVAKLRRLNIIPWRCIVDNTETLSATRGDSDMEAFVDREAQYFLTGYERDLLQNQENYVEVWVEKDALTTVVRRVCDPLGVRVHSTGGRCSATSIKNYDDRACDNAGYPVIIYLGDLDPSGTHMPIEIENALAEYHGVDIELHRVALNPEHVDEYNLPHSMEALKKPNKNGKGGDPNYHWHVERYGELAVELDALPPDVLMRLLSEALDEALDMEDIEEQRELEEEEQEALKAARARIKKKLTVDELLKPPRKIIK